MLQQTITIRDMDTDFAAAFVATAEKYQAQIMLKQGSRLINAKSIMGVMAIIDGSAETLIILSADGRDEKKAVAALTALAQKSGN